MAYAPRITVDVSSGQTIDEDLSAQEIAERDVLAADTAGRAAQEAEAAQERDAARAALRTAYQAVQDRLTTLSTDPTATDTTAKVRQAIADLAGNQKVLARLVKALLT